MDIAQVGRPDTAGRSDLRSLSSTALDVSRTAPLWLSERSITDPSSREKVARVVALTMTGVLLLWAVAQTVAIYRGAAVRGEVGWDANLYAFIGTHFIESGQAYFPIQSAPYEAEGVVNLYPPTALYLFVPASLLPRIMWWVVPLALIGWSLVRLRPAWRAWPLMALACMFPLQAPAIPVGLVYGNTLLWTMALLFVAAAFRVGIAWGAVLKPTDFVLGLPFALRSWRGFLVTIGLSTILLPLWFDWLDAMKHLEGLSPFFRSAGWPALAVPLIAYVARTRSRPRARPIRSLS